MEMKINSEIVIKKRKDKAWSQQHLADVCDVSLRTIQRAENDGNASYETQKALCSAFEIDVKDIALREKREGGKNSPTKKPFFILSFIFALFGSALVATVSTASTGVIVQAESVALSRDQNTVTYSGDVIVLIPEEELFEMSVLKNGLVTDEPNQFNLRIVNNNMELLVADPKITKVDKKIKITTSKLQTTRL
ncbi:helix-turn-helix transcriptional regulator [Alkalimonas collagenimarina]|uniref:Helix-turn-helix transcriptional regulator n=1 Tax=Alkalimonas collagenimarina TaxID=400390 RepID=A0ABT9H507_9GAMM|nr:helix-turn-helix transcriptional regulator [Alkalimonas collagenimarina]MDP4537970.1 helix-turn-helix transcriptional regulator [Alkalimonas collagenimarina]